MIDRYKKNFNLYQLRDLRGTRARKVKDFLNKSRRLSRCGVQAKWESSAERYRRICEIRRQQEPFEIREYVRASN